MKLEQLLINGLEVRTTTIDQQRMKLEQQPLINMGMKLEQQLLTNRELS